jgi:hypothetical protein
MKDAAAYMQNSALFLLPTVEGAPAGKMNINLVSQYIQITVRKNKHNITFLSFYICRWIASITFYEIIETVLYFCAITCKTVLNTDRMQ